MNETDILEPVQRLKRDIAQAAATLDKQEARYLVDAYYAIQDKRKAVHNQVRALGEAKEPNSVLVWLGQQDETLEAQIKRALEKWVMASPLGQWSQSICGIGPVISAGLMAHIDIKEAPTVGHIWNFAGLGFSTWLGREKAVQAVAQSLNKNENDFEATVQEMALATGMRAETIRRFASTNKEGAVTPITKESLTRAVARRPWNANLKTLCWKIGESFVKVSNRPQDYYGKIYQQRKALEKARNERGEYADQATTKLEKFKIGKTTEAYAQYSTGHLPDAHIHERAKRYAVKLFLAHWHHVAFVLEFKTDPPKPYPIAYLGHVDFISPPNFPTTNI